MAPEINKFYAYSIFCLSYLPYYNIIFPAVITQRWFGCVRKADRPVKTAQQIPKRLLGRLEEPW